MLRLNIRHALPQIDLRIQHSRVDDSHMIPAQVHTNNRQARSNKGATQPRIDIDSYPSRHAYGARTMNDFTRERGQKGISDVQSADSSHSRDAWNVIENGAKRGNFVAKQSRDALFEDAHKTMKIEAQAIPDPTIRVATPSQVVGEPDLGDVTAEINTAPSASVRATPGRAETYLKDQGFIRQWTTEDRYDIYA